MRAMGAVVIDKGIGKAQEQQAVAEASRARCRRQIANLRKLASFGMEPHLKTLRSYEKDSLQRGETGKNNQQQLPVSRWWWVK